MEAIIAIIGVIGIFFILTIPAYILNGFAIVKLWAWFVVPFGLQPITIAHAIGIGLIISLLTKQYVPQDKDNKYLPLIFSYIYPLVTLLVGWIVTWFM